jgi:hypothetical protein
MTATEQADDSLHATQSTLRGGGALVGCSSSRRDLWRVVVWPEGEPILPHTLKTLRADTVIRTDAQNVAATVEVVTAIFSKPQYIGLDLLDVLSVATGKTGGGGKALILAGSSYNEIAATIRHWANAMPSDGFDARSLLIAQLLHPADEPAFDLLSFSDFADAVLASSRIGHGLITACGEAKATMVAVIAFGQGA